MVKNILNNIVKELKTNKELSLLIIIVILFICVCIYFNNNKTSTFNNSKLNNFKNINKEIQIENIKTQINDTINKISREIDKYNINNSKKSKSQYQLTNISGIENFSGLPFLNQSNNSSLNIKINDNMTPLMQLKRMKIVLLELKKKLNTNEDINLKKNNISKENFEDTEIKAKGILADISKLLNDISKKRNHVSRDMMQTESKNYTVEEEVILKNNKNQEGRVADKQSNESVTIISEETEGIDTIFHPRLQII